MYPTPDDIPGLRVLTAAEASELLTVSIPVLERMRKAATGPRFIRLSARRVGYSVADLRAWMLKRSEGGQDAPA